MGEAGGLGGKTPSRWNREIPAFPGRDLDSVAEWVPVSHISLHASCEVPRQLPSLQAQRKCFVLETSSVGLSYTPVRWGASCRHPHFTDGKTESQ